MISNEQIAHDLTMIYMQNRYGIKVDMRLMDGDGHIRTQHFPDATEPDYKEVGTGETGFFGMEKTKKVRSGHRVDPLFKEMVQNYYEAYMNFYELLCGQNSKEKG